MNDKPIRIVNVEAVRLAKQRAEKEGRSASNAAARTIIEALGGDSNKNASDEQGENGGHK